VKVTVLGSGDAMGSGGRNFPAFVLSQGERHVLLDCGPSALPVYKALGLDTRGIQGMIISHLHGDHFGGIPYFFLDFQFISARSAAIFFVGPEGFRRQCEALVKAAYPDLAGHTWAFPIRYVEVAPGQIHEEGDLGLEAFPMAHGSQNALGYRIHWGGKVIGYTGDTTWNDRIPRLAAGCDLFLCECFFYDEDHPSHLRYVDLKAHREEIRSRRTLLFHLGPEMLQRIPSIEMEVAQDGMVIELGG
jgi:ribonuclease BN (tRNA processing enzyme)